MFFVANCGNNVETTVTKFQCFLFRSRIGQEISFSFVVITPLLPAATKLGQGNVFTSVCLSMGGCLPQCMLGYPPPWTRQTRREQTPQEQRPPRTRHYPPQTRHPPPPEQRPPDQADPPQEADCSIRLTSGRYASYWNAFLLFEEFNGM